MMTEVEILFHSQLSAEQLSVHTCYKSIGRTSFVDCNGTQLKHGRGQPILHVSADTVDIVVHRLLTMAMYMAKLSIEHSQHNVIKDVS